MPLNSTLPKTADKRPPLEKLTNPYVLFVDIVSFSTLNLPDQIVAIKRLQEVVRGTSNFKLRDTGQLLILATGDGMALVFFTDNVMPAVETAREISEGLRQDIDEETRVAVRIGIHMGPVFPFEDINDKRNVAGDGINTAQRVMDCGNAGHILLSEGVTSQLKDGTWDKKLTDLGMVNVKHGRGVHLFNLSDRSIGNETLPLKVEETRRGQTSGDVGVGGAIALIFAVLLISIITYFSGSQPVEAKVLLKRIENRTGREDVEELCTQLDAKLEQAFQRDPKLTFVREEEDKSGAHSLSARLVLTGSISNDNGRLKLDVGFDDRKEHAVFAKTYVIDQTGLNFEDVFAKESYALAQIKVALADVASNVRIRFTERSSWRTESEEAYLHYLKGSEYFHFNMPQDLDAAKYWFTKAIQRDKQFALGYVGLAQYFSRKNEFGLDGSPKEATIQALQYVEKAIELLNKEQKSGVSNEKVKDPR